MKRQIISYLENNNLISDEHHGGREGHSTISAKAIIDYNIGECHQSHKYTLVFSTDLSCAFDLVCHRTYLSKLKYYSFNPSSRKLIASYLSDRTQLVELHGKKSRVRISGSYSCVQGSKLSGIIYTMYTNEIPNIHKAMNNPELYKKITGEELERVENIYHKVTNFVDDSNSVIGSNSKEDLTKYMNQYFKLLKAYYNILKLQINAEKTNILVIPSNKNDNSEGIELREENKTIMPKKQIKILGFLLNPRMSLESHLNATILKVNAMIVNLRPIVKYMSEATRLKIANSNLKSLLTYGLELYPAENKNVQTKLWVQMMKISKEFVKQDKCFRKSNIDINDSLKWEEPKQEMFKSAIRMIHKIVKTGKPREIIKKLRLQRSRNCCGIFLRNPPKKESFKRNLICKSYQLYNIIPEELRTENPKRFKKQLKKWYMKTDEKDAEKYEIKKKKKTQPG